MQLEPKQEPLLPCRSGRLGLNTESPAPVGIGTCLLTGAILLEVGGTLCMRMTFQNEWWRVPAYVLYAASFSLFPWVLQYISLSIAYAAWCAIGIVAVSTTSMLFFGEGMQTHQIASLFGILLCVMVLNV